MKKALALALALLVATPAWADYRFNPYTGKLDYYETGMEDAPSDNSLYARKNAGWEAVSVEETDPIYSAWIASNPTSGTNTGDQTLPTARAISFTFDGNYASPTVASIASCIAPYSGTITGWKIIEVNGTSSSIVLTIKNNGSAISGTEKPTLSSASTNTDTSLTTWTTSVAKGDVITAYVDSASTGVLFTCSLYVEATS